VYFHAEQRNMAGTPVLRLCGTERIRGKKSQHVPGSLQGDRGRHTVRASSVEPKGNSQGDFAAQFLESTGGGGRAGAYGNLPRRLGQHQNGPGSNRLRSV